MAFAYRLEHEDGTPADPATFRTAVPNWKAGDVIPLGAARLVWSRCETTTQTSRRR
jgi:hypothetical protein